MASSISATWLETKANRIYGHGSKSKARTPSEHPNPTTKRVVLKWGVHLSQNGIIGFEARPYLPRLLTPTYLKRGRVLSKWAITMVITQ